MQEGAWQLLLELALEDESLEEWTVGTFAYCVAKVADEE